MLIGQVPVDIRHTVRQHGRMKPFQWSPDKNELLLESRGISFEDIVVAVESGGLLDIVEHPNQQRYPGQRILIVDLLGYAYLVPYVEEAEYFFLKTIIPSRKATRDFILNKGGRQ